MSEDRYRFHDTLVKWLSVALAIGGFVVAMYTYVEQQKATRDQAEQFEVNRGEEYKRRLWERQLELYFEACKAASTLATLTDPKQAEYSAARVRFDQLYYGELCVVESSQVSSCMSTFRNALVAAGDEPTDTARGKLRGACMELARACRASTEGAWKVDLGPLRSKP